MRNEANDHKKAALLPREIIYSILWNNLNFIGDSDDHDGFFFDWNEELSVTQNNFLYSGSLSPLMLEAMMIAVIKKSPECAQMKKN